MGQATTIRKTPRVRTNYEAHFSSQRSEGEATLADLSCSGARLEGASPKPNIGASAVLYIDLPDDPKPVQLTGRVVRLTDSGFAIEFEGPTPDAEKWLKDVAGDGPCAEEEDLDQKHSIDEQLATTHAKVVPVSDKKKSAKPAAASKKSSEKSSPDKIDLTGLSIAALEDLQQQIGIRLNKLRKEEEERQARDKTKKKLRDEIAKLAEKEGFTLEDLVTDEKD